MQGAQVKLVTPQGIEDLGMRAELTADFGDIMVRAGRQGACGGGVGGRERGLFSRITGNWRGRPLETFQTVVNLIANTTTKTGLVVRAELDPTLYPTGTKLTDAEKKAIPITRHEFHPDWNYTIRPSNE